MMSKTKQQLEQEIEYYERKIGRYLTNQEYVDPACSLQEAQRKLEKLKKKLFINYNID